MQKTLYLKASKNQISKYVIFSGDPGRVEKIITFMDDVELVGINREFHTYTGKYKDVRITVSSTGIGGASTAIALEEMWECGMEVAIRLGTVMGLKDDLLGKFIIPAGALRSEGTSNAYVTPGYPAVADMELIQSMNQSAREKGFEYDNGITCSCDGFYSQMKESRLSRQIGISVQHQLEKLKRLNISGVDMECSSLLTICRLMGVKACVVTMTTVLENLKDYLKGEERKKAEENDLVMVVLDGIVDYHKRQNNNEVV